MKKTVAAVIVCLLIGIVYTATGKKDQKNSNERQTLQIGDPSTATVEECQQKDKDYCGVHGDCHRLTPGQSRDEEVYCRCHKGYEGQRCEWLVIP